ncbi:hypothetical protein [cyanobacterium endosymbiont of Epithemia turgida]|uniref:hypothetical protein n=1 Tax=cyanobacterium endosymbiont of Epithemia turgida TaxID=718217 RepID=UPI0004D1B21A|nr:hypothetical protein [cyanobacterium endosymbiont of Epithemia turgida]BAP17080.1 hypothetical protein ETSB_0192 [cyanobacterium endosymbiont of Epithemia turgida isolate EtSB Lake Yunoko]
MPENKLSQEQLIFLLETTTQQLNRVLEILKKASPDKLPTTNTVETLVKTTQMIVADLEPSSCEVVLSTSHEEITAEWDKSTRSESSKPSLIPVVDFENSIGSKTWWDSFFRAFRLILPSSWNKNLSNWSIITILASILIVILFISILLFYRLLTPIAEDLSVPSRQKVVAISSPLKSLKIPQSMKILSSSEPRLTPEQNLIEAIRHDIIDLTNQYPEELIGLIEANFKASCLMITLGKEWYQLTPKKQNILAKNIFRHSQYLNFRKLEMIDSQGNLIAYSPVVGDEIVVFRR